MKNISVEGPKRLLKALADQWEENGWQSDVKWKKLAVEDYNLTHLILVNKGNTGKFGFYVHSSFVEYEYYTLPDDWNELADLKPEPVVEKGQYWENSDGLFRIMGSSTEYIKGWHGKQILSGENCAGFHINAKDVVQDYNLLSPEEVGKHLIEEAKRRGFKHNTKVFRSKHFHPNTGETYLDDRWPSKYYPEYDRLEVGGSSVYQQGQWAEIIDQTPEIKINGYTAEFHDDYVQFGCAKIKVTHLRALYNNLKDYMHGDELNNIFTNDYKWFNGIRIGKGVFTISDLKQIVDHYK